MVNSTSRPYPLKRSLWYPLNTRILVPQSGLDGMKKRKIFSPYGNSNPEPFNL
jgi:hypothetical protein